MTLPMSSIHTKQYALYSDECRASTRTFFKYADDTFLVGFLKPKNSSMGGFEEEVGNLIKCSDNFPEVNVAKTTEIIIGLRRSRV